MKTDTLPVPPRWTNIYVDEDGKRVSNQWVSVSNEDEWDDEMPETSWYYYGKDGKSVVSRLADH